MCVYVHTYTPTDTVHKNWDNAEVYYKEMFFSGSLFHKVWRIYSVAHHLFASS